MNRDFCDFLEFNFAYFDYAATTFMPKQVLEMQYYYNRNIGVSANRGKSVLANKANDMYQKARENVKNFFVGDDEKQLIFYRGTSYALNEIAYSIQHIINPMDIILIGPFEHHSNYLPWRELCRRRGAILFEMPLLENNSINIPYLEEIKSKIKVIAFSSVANINGFRMDIDAISPILNENVIVIVDDSQKCAHEKIENSPLIDCHIVNAHKMYGPKGIAGALVSSRMIDIMKPCIFGGGMIERVGFPNVWKSGVQAFECGTIDIGNVVAWSEACQYMSDIGYDTINMFENANFDTIIRLLENIRGVEIISDYRTKSLISFIHGNIHAHDIEDYFSNKGVIIRTGHLCSQNSIAKYNMKPLVRISFGLSNDEDDIEKLVKVIEEYL